MTDAQKQKVREEFDLFWGDAPKGSLKYQKGQEIFNYLIQKLEEGEREFISIVDQVLLDTFETEQGAIKGKDLSGSMFHFFIYEKLKNSTKQE